MRNIRDIDVKNKKVFLRLDLNVPIENGVIKDNNRIVASLKTINYLELQAKMGSLRYLSYPYFRSTIFDCMSLLGDDDDE